MNPATPQPEGSVIELRAAAVPLRANRDQVAIPGLNWTVRSGEFWVVGGLQGAGKSDLLALLAGLTSPLGGTCRVLGQTLGEADGPAALAQRLRVGIVFDHGGRPFHQLTVWENIALPLRYHRAWEPPRLEAHLEAWLDELELTPWQDRLPSALAPQWRQRMALARVLVLQPELLLLDNPLAVLDPAHTRWWIDLLGRLVAGHPLLDHRPLTLVATTDDFRPWRNPACQFAVLQDHQLRPLGDRSTIGRPEEPLLRDLLAAEADPP